MDQKFSMVTKFDTYLLKILKEKRIIVGVKRPREKHQLGSSVLREV